MTRQDCPITQAIRFLRGKKIEFKPHLYSYEEHGGTHHAANVLNIQEHSVIKTLVMETDEFHAFIILMHGDCNVSTKQLAHELGVKRVSPCNEATAQKYTGYKVGGTSPFGMRKQLPVYAETSIFTAERIYINGGKRGFLVEISPKDLEKALHVTKVNVAIRP